MESDHKSKREHRRDFQDAYAFLLGMVWSETDKYYVKPELQCFKDIRRMGVVFRWKAGDEYQQLFVDDFTAGNVRPGSVWQTPVIVEHLVKEKIILFPHMIPLPEQLA